MLAELRNLNEALRRLVSGRPYRKTAPSQMIAKITLNGTDRLQYFDPTVLLNTGQWPFVLTDVSRAYNSGSNTDTAIPTSGEDDCFRFAIEDARSEVFIFGNRNLMNLGFLGAASKNVAAAATLGPGNTTPLCFVPNGGYEIPPNGGFKVYIEAPDVVNADGTGSAETIYLLLNGYHILER